MGFEVWFVPTDEGQRSFRWKERLVSVHATEETAQIAAYDAGVGEASDFHQFAGYFVRPATT